MSPELIEFRRREQLQRLKGIIRRLLMPPSPSTEGRMQQ